MRTVIAVVSTALLVGATTATAQSLITSGSIQNNTIRSADVRNGTLSIRDLARSTRRALRGPRGFQGPAGLTGPAGPRGVSDIVYATSPTVTIGAGGESEAEAFCPAGTEVTGGAWFEGDIAFVLFTLISNQNSYVVRFRNPDATLTATVAVQAACAVK